MRCYCVCFSGEPLKKKKRMDVSIIIDREKKKKKKLEKEIVKLEKKGRLLKPIEEIEGDRAVLKTKRCESISKWFIANFPKIFWTT